MRRFFHAVWRILKPALEVVAALLIVLVLALATTLGTPTVAVKNALTGFAVAATSASTNGPLPGDQSDFPTEVACMKNLVTNPANHMTNLYPAIGSPEHTDSAHSGVFPCATFTGDLNGGNQVFQYSSESNYGSVGFISFKGPNDAYLYGGDLNASGPFVAKFDPATGAQIWRTPLTNPGLTGNWNVAGSFAIMGDGSIGAAEGPGIWRLDPNTGAILAYGRQPILGMPAQDANFDGFQQAPDARGTILLKAQTRAAGCTIQFQQAMSECSGTQPDTTVIAADPVTLKNIDAIKLNQSIVGRPIVTTWHGKIYMYMAGTKTLVRVQWNPATQKLTQDKSWAPSYLLKGQEPGPAPGLMGKWIVAEINAKPSTTSPMCLVAVSQDNPNDLHRICPWGKTLPVNGSTMSFTEASPGTDPQNNLVFMQDWLVGGVYAVHLDQSSGDLSVAWYRPDVRSTDFFQLIGPPDQRVIVSQDINPSFKNVEALTGTYNYTEGAIWMDEKTGKTLAESSLDNPSTAPGVPYNPGYGGRVYAMGNQGSIMIYQPTSCAESAATPAVPQSDTHCQPPPSPSPTSSPSTSPSG
jgi:hypothetical protein